MIPRPPRGGAQPPRRLLAGLPESGRGPLRMLVDVALLLEASGANNACGTPGALRPGMFICSLLKRQAIENEITGKATASASQLMCWTWHTRRGYLQLTDEAPSPLFCAGPQLPLRQARCTCNPSVTAFSALLVRCCPVFCPQLACQQLQDMLLGNHR